MLSGWWYTYPSVKYEIVSWDDDCIPKIWKVIIHSRKPNHQPVIIMVIIDGFFLFYPHYCHITRGIAISWFTNQKTTI